MREEIILNPVGEIMAEIDEPADMPLGGLSAVIEIYPEYAEALKGIEENSHIWVVAWFHKAPRDILKTVLRKVNEDLPEYGVFALRAYARPNPIALCLVELLKVEGNRLCVRGLDAVGGTPVLDIKPYYENDIVFSPDTPYIKGGKRQMRQGMMTKHARTHHREDCKDLHLAVRMAVIAEDNFGKVNSPEISICVKGSPCLADCLQGLTRARLSAPPRFAYEICSGENTSIWKKGYQGLKITAKRDFNLEEIMLLSDDELFDIELT